MKKELIASVASLQHNMEQWMGELHEHPELSMKEQGERMGLRCS